MQQYIVTQEVFEKDCKNLALRINQAPKPKDFNLSHLIALNEEGVKVATELRKTLEQKNLQIENIEIDPDTYEIKKSLSNKNIDGALLIIMIENSGKILTKALEYLNAEFSNSVDDVELMIIVLYDRLNVSSPTYQTPTFFGIGFPNHNEIVLEI